MIAAAAQSGQTPLGMWVSILGGICGLALLLINGGRRLGDQERHLKDQDDRFDRQDTVLERQNTVLAEQTAALAELRAHLEALRDQQH